MSSNFRIIGMLVGDIKHQPDMKTKYGPFFNALSRHFELIDVYDASLKGMDRWLNAIEMFHIQRKKWKERFFKNVHAFHLRSTRAGQYLQEKQGQYDFVLQLGTLFNSNLPVIPSNTLIYTDYTAALSARHPDGERSPFNPKQLSQWLELEKQAYSQAALIFTRTEPVKQSLIEDYNIPFEKIKRIGAGVNFQNLPPNNIKRQSYEPVALFIGKDFYRKGGDILLKAFSEVKAQLPQARLRILTDRPVPDIYDLTGVEIIRPTWERSQIEALFEQSNVLILPSRLETWGDVLLEAMAYQIPCIGVTGQAMEEIIEHNQTGILVEPENPTALSYAMLELMSQPGLLVRYGEAARNRIDTFFTWDHVIEQMKVFISSQQPGRHTNLIPY